MTQDKTVERETQVSKTISDVNLLAFRDEIQLKVWASQPSRTVRQSKKVDKGAWRMPWLMEAMKDVISCDKLRVGANNL